MRAYGEICWNVPLFRDIGLQDIKTVLSCLQADIRQVAGGQVVFLAGQKAERVGILLEGAVTVSKDDASGNRSILARLGPGELFGETFACASGEKKTLPVTVTAEESSVIMLVDYHKIITTCASACPYHTKLIENMLAVLADKNWMLNRRIEHLSKRSTRDKLLSFLEEQMVLQGTRNFSIPFDRQGLADYLCVERSAMSAVLGKLRDEGYLTFHRSRFHLKKDVWEWKRDSDENRQKTSQFDKDGPQKS